MAEDPPGPHGRNIAAEDVQIRTADRDGVHANDRVSWIGNHRIRDVFPGTLPGAAIHYSLHDVTNLPAPHDEGWSPRVTPASRTSTLQMSAIRPFTPGQTPSPLSGRALPSRPLTDASTRALRSSCAPRPCRASVRR